MANMECPICKKRVLFVGVHDDEGNYHGLMGCEYENAPWSGLSYALHHEGWGDCPLCTDGAYSTMGGMLFDTAEDAISSLLQTNEWVSVEERLPKEKQRVIVRCERVETSVGWILWGNWMTDIGPGAGKVTHWMPLPAPPDRRPPEGEEDT